MYYRFDGKKPVVGNDGSYVSETAIIIGDVRVGKRCYIGHGAILRGDYGTIVIGDETAVEEGAVVHAPPDDTCFIGEGVTIGHGAIIHCRRIGDSVGIGMGAILSIRSEIGSGSIVAEGSIVKREQIVPESVIVAGNPARKVKDVTDREREFWAMARRIYVDLAQKYKDGAMERIEIG